MTKALRKTLAVGHGVYPNMPENYEPFARSTADAKDASAMAFIEAHTLITPPAGCPEIQLHLGNSMAGVWDRAYEALGGAASRPPFWSLAWIGGLALARYVLDHPEVAAGRRVFDFGSGSGLCAIAAGKAGAALVSANEIDRIGCTAIALNAALNSTCIAVLDADLLGRPLAGYDVVLAGDVWYEQPLAEKVTPWLRRLASDGLEVLVGDRRRAFFPRSGLVELARYEIPTSLEVEQGNITTAGVWRIEP